MSSQIKPRTVLVFGSTGIQGSYLIKSLAQHNTPTVQWKILALTRSPSSSSAARLANLPGVKVVQVDKDCMENPAKVFDAVGGKGSVYGVFSVQGYVDDTAMVRQGKAIADASLEYGVKHLVYSSGDFGGMDNTGIDAFEVKRTVENYILTLEPKGLAHTFLRPAQFMENWVPTAPFILKMGRTATMLYTFNDHPEKKHQLISGRDIGKAGAKAFVEGPQWLGGVVRLAGDGLTMAELDQLFKEELGEPVQLAPWPLVRLVKSFVPVVKQMIVFFGQHNYNIDIEAVRREIPELEDMRSFLRRYKAEQGRK